MNHKYALLDRDGTLIHEPQDTFQVDSIEKLKILDGVIEGLQTLIAFKFKLIMVTNQNGVGRPSFPEENFKRPHEKMLAILRENGIEFEKVFVCRHLKSDGCNCRKPKTGLVDTWLKTADMDKNESFMYGDRDTDGGFAEKIGIRFIKATTNVGMNIRNLISQLDPNITPMDPKHIPRDTHRQTDRVAPDDHALLTHREKDSKDQTTAPKYFGVTEF